MKRKEKQTDLHADGLLVKNGERDDTPSYVYRCNTCEGIQGACVADLNNARLMRDALTFKRDAEKRGKTVEIMAVSDVRSALFCKGTCRAATRQMLPLESAQ